MILFFGLAILFSVFSTHSYSQNHPIRLRSDNISQTFPFDAKLYDSEPSAVEMEDGTLWVAWHVYSPLKNTERIVARSFEGGQPGGVVEITSGPGIYSEPEIFIASDQVVWVFWSEYDGNGWKVYTRSINNDKFKEKTQVSSQEIDAPLNASLLSTAEGFIVSYTGYFENKFQIRIRKFSNGKWGTEETISNTNNNSFRPTLAKDNQGNIWAFWDSYQNNESAIYGRIISPKKGSITRLSEPGDRYYQPVAAFSKHSGLCVASVKVEDVMGGEGAIDQLHTIQMSVYRAGEWQLVRDAKGDSSGAVITRGLLAKIEPNPVPTGGYLGRRLHPMLLNDDGYLWLFWERKTNQAGSTFLIPGDLIGRRFNGANWEDSKVFHQGHVDYRILKEAESNGGEFTVVSSGLPEHGVQNYQYFDQSLNEYKDFEQESWIGWEPVDLPFDRVKSNARFQLKEQAELYNLYWMDSHVHSSLSTDAEGEPDQIMYYARDRAKIDVMVSQENDYYLTPLTNYDYQLGQFFSKAISGPEFLVLHGFEWTSRLPTEEHKGSNTPFLWGNHFPNHRTIIYPETGGPLVRFTDVDNDINKLNDIVKKNGGVTHTQHPKFELTGHPVEIAVEAAAGWGTYMAKPEFIHSQLNDGFKFGFVGTTDSHRRNPGLNGGLTGIYATELTSEAILDAYKAKRFYATTGSKIALEARANDVLMGQEVTASQEVALTLNVKSPRPIQKVVLIRNGKEIKTFSVGSQLQSDFTFEDNNLNKGKYWYYWRVEIEGNSFHYGGNVMVAQGNLAWTTPNWVVVN